MRASVSWLISAVMWRDNEFVATDISVECTVRRGNGAARAAAVGRQSYGVGCLGVQRSLCRLIVSSVAAK
jgi:hypothetical protein